MIHYIVTTDRRAMLDYCEAQGVHPRAVRLVQHPQDLDGAELGANRIEFWGDYGRLPQLAAIVERARFQILGDIAENERRLAS